MHCIILGDQKQANTVMQQFEDDDVDFGVNVPQLLALTKLGADEAQCKAIIKEFDMNGSGIINVLDLLCGIVLLCDGTNDQKISAVFDAYDFDGTDSISIDEMTILLLSALKGITVMTKKGTEPPEKRMEELAELVSVLVY